MSTNQSNFSYLPLQKKNHKKITKQFFWKRASVATSWDMWPHYRKIIGFKVSLINPDYFKPDPEFDILDFRQYNKIFTMGGLWKKVICVIYIVIIWSKHKYKGNLKNYNFCVLSCFWKIEVQGSSLTYDVPTCLLIMHEKFVIHQTITSLSKRFQHNIFFLFNRKLTDWKMGKHKWMRIRPIVTVKIIMSSRFWRYNFGTLCFLYDQTRVTTPQ